MYSAGYPATTLFCPVILSQLPALFHSLHPSGCASSTPASFCLSSVTMCLVFFSCFSLVFFSPVGLLPFHHVEVLVPTGAFESSCRKAPTKTVSCILPASDKPVPSVSSRSVLMSCFSCYFTVLHIVAVHLSPGDHCWNPGLYLLPAGEWAQVLEPQTRDRKQLIIVPFLQPELGLEAWDLGSDWGSSFCLSVLTHHPTQKKILGYFLLLTQ